MNKFKEATFKYSLMLLPTLLFFSVVCVGNILIANNKEIKKENSEEFIIEKTQQYQTNHISLKEKVNWCNKRSDCSILAELGYHEARGETDHGVVSVMHTTLNRVKSKHPIFKNQNTIRKVVYAKHQFSYVLDGSKARGMKSKKQADRVKVLAYDVLNKLIEDTTNGSLYYHTHAISPNWSHVYAYTLTIGNHKFYKHN